MPRIPPKRVPVRPDGQPLSAEDIRELREQIASFDTIEVIADEMREIVERYMPDLADRLPPKKTGQKRPKGKTPRKR